MASRGKKKTTMAKLSRESRLRERRLDKQARKDARRQAAAEPQLEPGEEALAENEETVADEETVANGQGLSGESTDRSAAPGAPLSLQ